GSLRAMSALCPQATPFCERSQNDSPVCERSQTGYPSGREVGLRELVNRIHLCRSTIGKHDLSVLDRAFADASQLGGLARAENRGALVPLAQRHLGRFPHAPEHVAKSA